MLQKFFVFFLFLAAQFLISWYGNFSGKLPVQGTYLGIHYNSAFGRAFVTQLDFLWLLIIINVLFSLGFHYGFASSKNFLVIATLWLASGPLAALLFNALFVKEKVDMPLIIGIFFVAFGAILVVAHKEIVNIF